MRFTEIFEENYKTIMEDDDLDSLTDDDISDDDTSDDDTNTDDTNTNDSVDSADDTSDDNQPMALPTTNAETKEDEKDNVENELNKNIGITNIEHTSSTTIIDFEDGNQIMYVHPIISLKATTIKKIMSLISDDISDIYSDLEDAISEKSLKNTKYWKSVKTLIEMMVKTQLTKSDNFESLLNEISYVFKLLELK
jgi:hypothetical protein